MMSTADEAPSSPSFLTLDFITPVSRVFSLVNINMEHAAENLPCVHMQDYPKCLVGDPVNAET